MFIREYHTTNIKTGKIYTTHKLAESVMTEKSPRQRIVMNLGTLSLPKNEWKKLSSLIEVKLSGQIALFDKEPIIEDIADKAIEHYKLIKTVNKQDIERKQNQELLNIDINSLATINHRSLGAEIVAHNTWNKLGFGSILAECGFDNRQKSIAEAVIVGRLINPDSDMETFRWFQNRSSLSEMLETDLSQVGKDAFYEIVDDIFDHKETIEKRLAQKEAKLYNRGADTIFLYDLTNTY